MSLARSKNKFQLSALFPRRNRAERAPLLSRRRQIVPALHRSPRSPAPWIALVIGVLFALIAIAGAAAILTQPQAQSQLDMRVLPPQAPGLPNPSLPTIPG